MTKRAFDKIMGGLQDAEAFLTGNQEGAVVTSIPEVDVRAVRTKVGGSREAFSERFGLDHRAVQDWEQGRRKPDRSTRVLMLVIEQNPRAVERAVSRVIKSGGRMATLRGHRITRLTPGKRAARAASHHRPD